MNMKFNHSVLQEHIYDNVIDLCKGKWKITQDFPDASHVNFGSVGYCYINAKSAKEDYDLIIHLIKTLKD